MLDGGEEHGDRAEHNKRNAYDRRKVWSGIDGRSRQATLHREKVKKQAEARDHKAEAHDGEAGTDPG